MLNLPFFSGNERQIRRLAKLRIVLRVCPPIVSVALLGGCETPYKEPPNGPGTTTILLQNEAAANESTGWHHDQWNHLGVFIYGGNQQCTDRTIVPGDIGPGAKQEVRVQADRELTLTASSVLYSGRTFVPCPGCFGVEFIGCTPTISFVPERGRHYEFDFTVKDYSCPVQVLDTTDGDAPQAVPFTTRNWIRPLTASGPSCEKREVPGEKTGGSDTAPSP